jgi:hypothetical protein
VAQAAFSAAVLENANALHRRWRNRESASRSAPLDFGLAASGDMRLRLQAMSRAIRLNKVGTVSSAGEFGCMR